MTTHEPISAAGHETVFVDQFTNGTLDPNRPMLGSVRDGGHIVANTAPGCWGPMLTPEIRGGHEVTLVTPVWCRSPSAPRSTAWRRWGCCRLCASNTA